MQREYLLYCESNGGYVVQNSVKFIKYNVNLSAHIAITMKSANLAISAEICGNMYLFGNVCFHIKFEQTRTLTQIAITHIARKLIGRAQL